MTFKLPETEAHNWGWLVDSTVAPTTWFRHCCSVPKSCLTLCCPMDCSMLGFHGLHYLLELAQINVHELVLPSKHLILCCCFCSQSFPHQVLFQWVGSLHQVAKVWKLQHQSFQLEGDFWCWSCSAFFMVQLSHSYMATGKTIALTIWSFSFSISPSNEYSRLISFRIDWFDFHTVQGTLKSLLQHHNSKA